MKTSCLLLILTATALRAQEEFTLEWSSISGGSQPAGAGPGEFTLEATIGQPAAAAPATGLAGEFSISGGYWTFTLNEPLDLGMTMQINGGSVSLTWDDSTRVAVRLESSTDLQLWTPVNPQPPHPPFLESTGQRRFYRLMPGP